MTTENELIYTVRELCGDDKPTGFYLPVNNYLSNLIEYVPNYLFKDAKAQYPEIRITPFISEENATHSIRERALDYDIKKEHKHAIFQIDIYAKTIPEVNNIYNALYNRIDFFRDMDTITYGYDKRFHKYKKDKEIYVNREYSDKHFIISRIDVQGYKFQKVKSIQEMQDQYNVWYLDDTGLYVKPNADLNFHKIQIYSVINGKLFQNGDTIYSRGIGNLKILNKRMLSDLEDNEVERINFELHIFYVQTQSRKPGPILDKVGFKKKIK